MRQDCLGYTILFHLSSWLSTASLIYLLQSRNYRSFINFPGSLNLLLWTFCSEFHILYIKFILYPFGNLVSPGNIHLGEFYPAWEQLMSTQSQLLHFHLGLWSMQWSLIKYGWNYGILLYNKITDPTSLCGISSSNKSVALDLSFFKSDFSLNQMSLLNRKQSWDSLRSDSNLFVIAAFKSSKQNCVLNQCKLSE